MLLKVVLAISLFYIQHTKSANTLCYFASWAGYRTGNGAYKPSNINPNLCTHVLYAFLGVSAEGELEFLDPWNDLDLGCIANVEHLKGANPDLKVLISIGGWNAGNAILSGIVASSKLRSNLIQSCLDFFNKHGYDGIDIDWEFPEPADKVDFVKLLQEMQAAFNAEGHILSVTASADPRPAYDVPEISKVVDLLNIMTYDFNTAADGVTGHNAPLYGSLSVNNSVQSWLEAGADFSKLTISVPFYGHTFSLVSEDDHSVGAPAEIGIGGPYTQSPGILGYNEVCEFYNDWTRIWDEDAQVPYIYDGTNWASYDDSESIGLKAKYIIDNGLGGITVWSIDTDDFHGICGNKNPLLQSIADIFAT